MLQWGPGDQHGESSAGEEGESGQSEKPWLPPENTVGDDFEDSTLRETERHWKVLNRVVTDLLKFQKKHSDFYFENKPERAVDWIREQR